MKITDSALYPARPRAAEGTNRTAVGSKDQRNGNRGVVEPQRIQTGFVFIICVSETKHGSVPNHATGHRKRKTKRRTVCDGRLRLTAAQPSSLCNRPRKSVTFFSGHR
ncbi:hypothetical protein EVAR_31045_1 [Eumeta japonica]|uniref:Uncharacterized protein n=1 Tax=Eumeta variegata TaxID=151549 RepID=A0A4C1VFI3_EUMVA|nr:hypothetical protein EVAR_31045_1 [Eumeta japonica]